jgi:hypothetical protein
MSSTILASQLTVGTVVLDGGRRIKITRIHAGVPKGKVCVSYRTSSGYGMVELDDTERLNVAVLKPRTAS